MGKESHESLSEHRSSSILDPSSALSQMCKAGFFIKFAPHKWKKKGRNARFNQEMQGMEWSLEKACLVSSLLSFPMTWHLKRAVNTEDIFIIKSAKLQHVLSSFILYNCWGCTIYELIRRVFLALCVHTHYMWSEEGILQDLFGWKSGVCMCFVILKTLGVCISTSDRDCLAFSKSLALLPSQFVFLQETRCRNIP